jgi:hypothetical protein
MPNLICAWCGKVLKRGINTDRNSHGICPECKKKLLEKYAKGKE